MKENLHLFIKCFICWFYGFKTKTGGENYLRIQGNKENKKYYLGSQRNPRENNGS
jgi:hypothetical protein